MKSPRNLILPLITILTLLIGCGPTHQNSEIENAMIKYDRLIKKMDADSISILFTIDGKLGSMAHGRDAIKKFLSSFKNVHVIHQESTTESVNISGNEAVQKGNYNQIDIMSKDTIRVKGEFTANWIWSANEGWLIKSIETKPKN